MLPYDQQVIQQVKDYVQTWHPRLFLPDWEITVLPADDLDKDSAYMARMCAQPEYLQACIRVNLRHHWLVDPVQDEKAVLHELCHLFTSPGRHAAYDFLAGKRVNDWNRLAEEDEQTVERIARTVWRAYMEAPTIVYCAPSQNNQRPIVGFTPSGQAIREPT